MEENREGTTRLISGRDFTPQELDDIKETARLFPKLTQRELAQTDSK